MKKIESFIKFKDNIIHIVNVDGMVWITLKSLCKALNIDYKTQISLIKGNIFFTGKIQPQFVKKIPEQDKSPQNKTCIPEYLVYSWITVVSKNESNNKIFVEVYETIYQHFHGIISGRRDLLSERDKLNKAISDKKKELWNNNPDFIELQDLQMKRTKLTRQLIKMDKSISKEPDNE